MRTRCFEKCRSGEGRAGGRVGGGERGKGRDGCRAFLWMGKRISKTPSWEKEEEGTERGDE
jgi:hypothetical protein